MHRFADELRRFGPESTVRTSREEAIAYCAALTASHYENFSVVTRLTPPALIPAFRAVYAFCRWSDDLGDEIGDRARSTELLGWWRSELRAMFEGAPRHPVTIALADVVAEFAIPIDPFEALISAFEQDQVVTDYDTYEQLIDYCTRSANPVGHLILYLGRVHTPENVALADATCTALQLANFWQDVARDLDIGRVYLPREDRMRFGYPDADLHARRFSPAFAGLLGFEVDRTRALFRVGRPLADRMPGRLALDVELFTRGGLAILDRIEGQGFDVFRRRPAVGKAAKIGLLMRAILARTLRSRAAALDVGSGDRQPPVGDSGRQQPPSTRLRGEGSGVRGSATFDEPGDTRSPLTPALSPRGRGEREIEIGPVAPALDGPAAPVLDGPAAKAVGRGADCDVRAISSADRSEGRP